MESKGVIHRGIIITREDLKMIAEELGYELIRKSETK